VSVRKKETNGLINCVWNYLIKKKFRKERTDSEASKELGAFSGDCNAQDVQKQDECEAREVSTRCLICMEGYVSPLISVNCWHVHCKTCWMQSLGAKKLCNAFISLDVFNPCTSKAVFFLIQLPILRGSRI